MAAVLTLALSPIWAVALGDTTIAKPDAKALAEANAKAAKAVQTAGVALLKEFAAWQKDPNTNHLRKKCDYFIDNPSPDVTPAAILNSLQRGFDTDPSGDLYVKWQLLSGVGSKFDQNLAQEAFSIYLRAPYPPRNPYLNHQPLDQMAMQVGPNGAGKVDSINQQCVPALDRFREASVPYLRFRDELYARIPSTYDMIIAGLKDIDTRVNLGADATDLANSVMVSTQTWMADSAPPAQIRQLAAIYTALRTKNDDRNNQVYGSVKWNGTQLEWVGQTAVANSGSLTDLAKNLTDQANNPPQELGFKKNN